LGKTSKAGWPGSLTISSFYAPVRQTKRRLLAGIAAISENVLNEGEQSSGLAQQLKRTLEVINVGKKR
jgi:hypothetical protein